MELTHDWKTFQSIFYTKKKFCAATPQGPVYVIVDQKTIVSVLSESDDLGEWVGSTADDLMAEYPTRDFFLYPKDKVEEAMSHSVDMPHYYDQTQYLRREVKPRWSNRPKYKAQDSVHRGHFLLEAIETWWKKVFPSHYGIYLQLEGKSDPLSLLLLIQRGRINAFHVPDLSPMMKIHREQPHQVIRHLSENYMMPIQGLFLKKEEWLEWSEMSNPWSEILASIKSNRNRMVPFKWGSSHAHCEPQLLRFLDPGIKCLEIDPSVCQMRKSLLIALESAADGVIRIFRVFNL